MLLFCVQYAKDNDAVAFNAIKKFVGKTTGEQPAKVAVIKRSAFRVGFQQAQRVANLRQQFIAQAGALGFIP